MGDTTKVTMPQLGESVHEGTISRWLVRPGEKVVEFEPMVEVDTDKVSAEVPAPVSGILREILAAEGQTVLAGAEIAVVELDGEGDAPAAEIPPEDTVPVARPQVQSQPGARSASGPAAPAAARSTSGEHRYSPAVVMLAQEHELDLARVTGTGLGGRVTKKDVLTFIDRTTAKPDSAPLGPPTPAVTPSEGDEIVQLTRVRRLIAENMVRSKTTIPHAWQTQEVDMSGVVANRNANKGRFQKEHGFSLTYLPYVIKAAAVGLRENRAVNATFNQTEILVHRDVNIGISIGLEDTLVVPVVRNADGLSITGIARSVAGLAEKARTRRLTADDLQGATFTVNNSGTFGTLFSYSVISPGQAGILTMEAIVERPVAVNGMIGVKPMMYLCFSFDHRALDGLQAARFLVSCRRWLQSLTADTPIY